MTTKTLTHEEWDSLYSAILAARENYARVTNDISTDELVEVVENWLSAWGFA